MNRLCRKRSSRSEMGASRSGVLAATFAAAILANSVTWTVALAQQPGPVTQQRDEASIGYVQPRVQDLPPSVAQDGARTRRHRQGTQQAREQNLPRLLSWTLPR